MTEQEFVDSLSRQESDILDFKSKQYDFSGTNKEEKQNKRAKFIKDIICMANTPREGPAHIVLGVKLYSDGTKEMKGITEHIDDADLQTKVSGWVHPHPCFTYEPIRYKNKVYGVISVPPVRNIGPYYYNKDAIGNILIPHRVYLRRSSQNATASQEEQKAVYAWFLESGYNGLLPTIDSATYPWDYFMKLVENFNPRRSFALVLSPLSSDFKSTYISALAGVNWFFVADFDPGSASDGAFAASREILENRRALHLLTKGDSVNFSPRNATYWYLARGIEGRGETLATGKWLDWHRAYSLDLHDKVSAFSKVVQRPITIIVFWYSQSLSRYLNSFLEIAVPPLGSGVDIIIVSDEGDTFKTMGQDYGAKVVQIPLHHLLGGLREFTAKSSNKSSAAVVIPSSTGANIELEAKVVGWIEEELEIVHPNLGRRPPADASGVNEFLRGKPISWFDLALHMDVERDLEPKLHRQVEVLLQKRRTVRVNLYHEPGSGGSTLARRVVWDLRNDYPCVVLHRCHPKQTVERLQKLFSISGNSLIVLAEGNRLSEKQSDELATLLSSRNIPAVILQVLRRFEKPSSLSENSHYLEAVLTLGELYRFENILCRDIPDRAAAIKKSVGSKLDVEKTPFYLGLVAFEKNFVSLPTYIERHFEHLNDIQRKALIYLSLAHFYGQLPLDAQMFAGLFELPPNKSVDLTNVFSEYALRLLVKTDAVSWRPAHQLIAGEFLEQALSLGLDDRRLWPNSLSDVALEFAEFCAQCDGDKWESVSDLLQRVFIYRGETEMLGTVSAGTNLFAKIIMDIPVDEGRLRVFIRLTELYPENSHFWAHLGRFYANQLRQHDKAITAIDKALALHDQDHVVHHMKGMVLRNWMYDLIRRSEPLDEVIARAKQASESFQKAREMSPDDDYGFISEVQLITKLLDYGAKTSGRNAILVTANHQDNWFRESFDVAENLLEEVKRKRQSEKENEYESRCRADLDFLYGKHGEALQTWQNLLDRRTTYAPPIRRQIIRTLLVRSKQSWELMPDRDVERSLDLLQKNVIEEPNDGRNIRLWLQALRASNKSLPIEDVIEKIAYWASTTASFEANYYLYILYALNAIDGSSLAIERCENALEKCRYQTKYRRDRRKSYEWLGLGKGLNGLVHQDALGSWNHNTNFWQHTQRLRRQNGIIINIRGPEAGTIEVAGLKAFFVPGVSGHSFGEAENRRVSFFLGFSFDGLRAWSVEDAF